MHDLVRDISWDVLKRAVISSKKEALVNFLTDTLEGGLLYGLQIFLVFGWEGGNTRVWTLQECPLLLLRNNGFVGSHAAIKAESCKVAKHEKACLENQHVFIIFVFDTFGFLALKVVNLLNKAQKVMRCNILSLMTQNIVFSMIY
ncbi:hypothetical protein R6Q59_017038 [Mikania micrantha]